MRTKFRQQRSVQLVMNVLFSVFEHSNNERPMSDSLGPYVGGTSFHPRAMKAQEEWGRQFIELFTSKNPDKPSVPFGFFSAAARTFHRSHLYYQSLYGSSYHHPLFAFTIQQREQVKKKSTQLRPIASSAPSQQKHIIRETLAHKLRVYTMLHLIFTQLF